MPLTLAQRLALWFRKSPVGPIHRALRLAEAEGLPVTRRDLESHALSGGDPEWVVRTMMSESRRTIRDLQRLAAADLASVLRPMDA